MSSSRGIRRKLHTMIMLLLAVLLMGSAGYATLLDIPWLDAIYMTVITVSTVGYGEVAPLHFEAKIFTIVLILVSVSIFAYAISQVVSLLLQGDLRKEWRLERMEALIARMHNHYIVCGYNRTSQYALLDFKRSRSDMVIIEEDEKLVEELDGQGYLVIQGDPSDESVLQQAGIFFAKGLLTALEDDADNVYVVLTARRMNPKLHIVSRAIAPGSRDKLLLAGADNTVSSNEIGGRRMASMVSRPDVVAFLESLTYAGNIELDLESAQIQSSSPIAGQTLAEAKIPSKTGMVVLAIRAKDSEEIQYNPHYNTRLNAGDVLIVLGSHDQLDDLRKLIK